MGARSTYQPENAARAKRECSIYGADLKQLAASFGCTVRTISKWQVVYPKFAKAVHAGKDDYDTKNVEKSLLKRALGYDYEEITYVMAADGIEVVDKRVKKHMAGDTTAMIFWLKNRHPDRWRDRHDIDLESSGGVAITIVKTYEKKEKVIT